MDKVPDFVDQFAVVDFLSYLIPGCFFMGYEYWLLGDSGRVLLNGPVEALFPGNQLVESIVFLACGYIAGMLLGMLGSGVWDILYAEVSRKPDSGTGLIQFIKKHMFFLGILGGCGGLFYPLSQLVSAIWKRFLGEKSSWEMPRENITLQGVFLGIFAGVVFAAAVLILGNKDTKETKEKLIKLKLRAEQERKIKLYQSFHLMFRDLSTAVVILMFQVFSETPEILKQLNQDKLFSVGLYGLMMLFASRGMQYRKYYKEYLDALADQLQTGSQVSV